MAAPAFRRRPLEQIFPLRRKPRMTRTAITIRTLVFAAGVAIALAFVATPPAMAQVTVLVGGRQLALNPGSIERNGRVFVPLRGIFERLGATVVYSAGTINATKGRSTVSLQIGSTQATIDGHPQYLDVAPFIVGATTYVPLRFVAQSLGANVNYNDSTRVVSIGMGGRTPPYTPVRPNPPPPYPQPGPNVRLMAQQPAPGTTVGNRFATIAAQFSRPVRPGTVRVWLDGSDVTYRSGASANGFSYRPPAPLNFGSHTVRVAGSAYDGAGFDRSWSFATGGAPPISPIDLKTHQPGPGSSITNRFATIAAQFSRSVDGSSVRVWLDGANVTNQCGVSNAGFSYKPPAPLAFGSHTVRVAGSGNGGMRFDRSWSFTVARTKPAEMTLTIGQPASDASVGTTFNVVGHTVPNGRIRVTAGASPSSTGQFTGTATAGPRGNFRVNVTLKRLLGQQSVRVRIVATDPVTSQSTETTLQLRINP
jgi:hypothetical protein